MNSWYICCNCGHCYGTANNSMFVRAHTEDMALKFAAQRFPCPHELCGDKYSAKKMHTSWCSVVDYARQNDIPFACI